MQHLSTQFADSKLWLKTKAGALKRINELGKMIDREVDSFTWIVLDRPARVKGINDNEYLPVALLGDHNRHVALACINRGIAVFKA